MKKIFTLFLGTFLFASLIISQEAPPQAFSFKAMIKDKTGSPVVNRTISLRISIIQGEANGVTVYSERFRPTTNLYAQVDVEIGRGTVLYGIFSDINWGADEYYLKVEVDPKGGTNYYVMSVSQLLSVPYALFAGNLSGGQDNDDDAENELISNAYLSGTVLTIVEGDATTLVELSGLLNYFEDDDANPTNELQNLLLNGHELTIQNGNTITLPDEVNDADHDPTNEIQVLSLVGNILTLSTNGSPIEIDLTPYLDNTDSQLLSLDGHQLTIQNGNMVILPDDVIDSDADPLNEIQQLTISGDRIILSRDGGYVDIPVANTVNGLFFYGDKDKDGFGDLFKALWVPVNVTPPSGYVSTATDCNDSNAEVKPGARDICDGLDNDCDGITDENCLMPECYQALVALFSCAEESCPEFSPDCLMNSCTPQFETVVSCEGGDCITSLLMDPDTWLIIQSYTIEQKANYFVEHCSSPDDDADGYTMAEGDCNDTDPSVHPGAIDIPGDGIDQNCNGHDAEAGDDDDDTYTEAEGDCNDTNPEIHPGVTDLCDGVNNDCDGQTDEDASWQTYYLDSDHDGFGDPAVTASYCSAEQASAVNYILIGGDCDDSDPEINPGIDEANEDYYGDTVDQDCKDGDLPCSAIEDNDEDGYSEVKGDCNDSDDSIYPGAPEIPGDGIDQNCNGHDQKYGDNDDDGYTPAEGDCDDFNSSVHPGTPEICWDGVDQNCDGTVDEGCCIAGLINLMNCVEASGCSLSDINCISSHCGNEFYSLQEQYCFDFQCISRILTDPALPFDGTWTTEAKAYYILSKCGMFDNDGDGYSGEQGDCDDTNPAIHPGAAEICGDGIDQNCTGSDASCDDVDEDGFTADDCDDNNFFTHPGAMEICDGKDNNCNGEIDEGIDELPTWFRDADGDGYGSVDREEITEACLQPAGYVDNDMDCDDTDGTIHPDAVEVCGDGIDQDCDGNDQLCPSDIDDDNDGFTENQGDCDDANRRISPGEMEYCGDDVDNNCNGLVDEDPDVTPSAGIASSIDLEFGSDLVLAAAPPGLSTGCVNYLIYEWDLLSNGIYDFTGQEVTVSWDNLVSILGSVTPPAVFSVTLTVSDQEGYAVNSTLNFNIWPVNPVACFSVTPETGYSNGDFTFDGSCSNHPNPNRTILLYEWKVRGFDDVFMTADLFWYNFDNTIFDIIPPDKAKTLEIVLRVTDDQGNFSETSHNITLNDDQDTDGYAIRDDCDDAAPNVYPGATEICGDGIDQDCDGEVDEGCTATCSSDSECLPGYHCQNNECVPNLPDGSPCATNSQCMSGICLNGFCVTSSSEDKDQDGYPETTDCNDNDASIHPGAIEILDDNIDQDCNGNDLNSETFALGSNDPYEAAKAIGIYQGLISASWVLPDGSPSSDGPNYTSGYGLLSSFGSNVVPLEGSQMLALSTGTARTPSDPGYVSNFNKGYSVSLPEGSPANSFNCPTPTSFHDGLALKVSLHVPENVTHFEFSFKFYTSEFPNYICSQYNDVAVAMMSPGPFHASDNIIYDSSGNPLCVNNAYLECCTAVPPAFQCPSGTSELIGTGFENGGGTLWHQTLVPVQPGTTIEVTFAIWDSGDHAYDSTMLIDNWKWMTN